MRKPRGGELRTKTRFPKALVRRSASRAGGVKLAYGALLSLAVSSALADSAEGGLEEIIVTAQRRAENSQDVPVAISAFSAADLERAGVRQAGDIAAMVPNLVVVSPYGTEAQPVFSLRGVTTDDFSQNQSAPVAMYVDEAYKAVGALQALQTYDLDRVEVLRGPQGTLYGKNATGGAVSFYTRNPDLENYDGYLTAGIGNYNARTLEGAIGGPISDGVLGWRGAVYYDDREGWLRSIIPGVRPENGIDALAGRLTFFAKPADEVTVQLKMSASRSGGTPYGDRPINIIPSITGADPQLGPFENAALYAYDKVLDNENVTLKVDWKVAEHAVLTSVTAYDYGRWVETGDDASVGTQIWGPDTYASSINTTSEELRLASLDAGRWTWLGGLYFDHDALHGWNQYHYFDAYPGTIFLPGSTTPLYGFDQANNYDQIRESKSAFANASFDITPEVTVRGGVRLTMDDLAVKNYLALEGGLLNAPTCVCINQPTLWTQTIPLIPGTYVDFAPGIYPRSPTLPERSTDNNNVTYKTGIDWKPAPGMLTYLSVSTGYRGAALNSQAFNAPVEVNFAKPERLMAYEIGLKSELLDRRLQLNAAIFYYNYKDQQFLVSSSESGVLLYQEVNAPKSRVEGGEVETRVKAATGLELHWNLGYQDGKYLDFTYDGVNVSGNQLALSPRFTSSGGIDWTVGPVLDGSLLISVDGSYQSKDYWDPENTQRIAQGAYFLVNARSTLTLGPSQRYAITIWGKNLADRAYNAYALPTQTPAEGGLGLDYTNPAEPRTFGLSGSVKF